MERTFTINKRGIVKLYIKKRERENFWKLAIFDCHPNKFCDIPNKHPTNFLICPTWASFIPGVNHFVNCVTVTNTFFSGPESRGRVLIFLYHRCKSLFSATYLIHKGEKKTWQGLVDFLKYVFPLFCCFTNCVFIQLGLFDFDDKYPGWMECYPSLFLS